MPIRVLVTGRQGQVARALAELGPACDVEVIPMGRPRLDLIAPETVESTLRAATPDIVVSSAAYTAVDTTPAPANILCSGQEQMAGGRIVVVGGHVDALDFRIFPVASTRAALRTLLLALSSEASVSE